MPSATPSSVNCGTSVDRSHYGNKHTGVRLAPGPFLPSVDDEGNARGKDTGVLSLLSRVQLWLLIRERGVLDPERESWRERAKKKERLKDRKTI